jgi:hypothetical protein
MEEGKTEKIVLAHNNEIEAVKAQYPQTAEELEKFKVELRRTIKQIHAEVHDIIDDADQVFLSALMINSIHRLTDEIFL